MYIFAAIIINKLYNKTKLKLFLISVFLLSITIISNGQDRAMWATIWSSNTAAKIDNIINDASINNFNKVFLQVRYRADAMYIPNRIDSTYQNNELRCYILKDPTFDPLRYAIVKAKEKNIEIHAWVPIFVVTPHDLSKISETHIYNTHKEWLTYDQSGVVMAYNSHEGAFLDPGISDVQNYTLDILRDIAINYNIDGIQLDYIRYPDSLYGFNPIAIQNFKNSDTNNFAAWKQMQINSFVQKSFRMLKEIDTNIQVSAAVFGNQRKAIDMFSQNWKTWLNQNYIDKVYVMAYNTSDKSFTKVLQSISEVDKRKTNIVLRAWVDRGHYKVHQINNKIEISKKMNFVNFGFYSYSGLIKNNYISRIKY